MSSAPSQSGVSITQSLRSAWATVRADPKTSLLILPVIVAASVVFVVGVELVGALLPYSLQEWWGMLAVFLFYVYATSVVTRTLLALSVSHSKIALSHMLTLHGTARLLGVVALSQIIIVAGIYALIVPGIIFAIMFSFAPYIVLEKGYGPIAALKESAAMTRGIRWSLFAAAVVLGLVIIAGLLVLGVGVLVAAPLAALAHVYLYRQAHDRHIALPDSGSRGRMVNYIIAFALAVLVLAGILSALTDEAALEGTTDELSVIDDMRNAVARLDSEDGQATAIQATLATAGERYESASGFSFMVPSHMAVVSDEVVQLRADGRPWHRIMLKSDATDDSVLRIMIEIRPLSWAFENDDVIYDFFYSPYGFRIAQVLESESPEAFDDGIRAMVAPLNAPHFSAVVYGSFVEAGDQEDGEVSSEARFVSLIESLAW